MSLKEFIKELNIVDPSRVRIGRSEIPNEVTLRLDGKVTLHATLKKPFPVSHPEFIIFNDARGKETCMIKDYMKLDGESRVNLEFVLEKLYFIPKIERVINLRTSGDEFQWEVLTNKGKRSFSTRGRHNVFLISPKIIMVDTDSNVYIIPDFGRLDRKSRFFVSSAA